jgi:DNA modification methylase
LSTAVHLLKRFILDPFVRTGTAAVAVKKLDRRHMSFDIDDNCVNMAKAS